MQLNELINQYSLNTIFEKTKISKEVLEKLSNKEFEKFKRVQVFGFIKIIEREFGVDLNEFKQEAEEFFATHNDQKHSSASISILDSDSAPSSGSGFMGIVFGIVTLAIIGYGGWFFYNKESKPTTIPQESNNSKESMFTSTLNSAKSLLGVDSNKTENNQNKEETTPTNNTNQPEHKKFDVTTPASQPSNNQDGINSLNTQVTNGANPQESTKEKVEKLIAKSTNATKKEDNNTQESINLQPTQTDINNRTKNSLTSNAEQTQDNTNNLEAKEINNTQTNENNISQTDSNTTDEVAQNRIDSAKLILKSKRLWIGIYNLKTKKRVSKFIKRSFDFDLSNGDLAIVTGHSMFDLEINGETKKFGGVKKSYILLSKDKGLKVLTKQEYRKLTKKRAW